ncbi:MAG: DUF4097 domain-containing protein [Christensenellaceae bacterium]|jgi:hypothetical protein|nr:DUF4097 domain-containing protein [Christensenellaceae bacterium]
MRKFAKILAITAGCMVLCGLVIGIVGMLNYRSDPGYLRAAEGSQAYVEGQGASQPGGASIAAMRRAASFKKEFSEEIQSLSIHASLSNLTLHKSPDSTLRVEVLGRLPEDLEIELTNGAFSLNEVYDQGPFQSFFNFGPFHIGSGGPFVDSTGWRWSDSYMGEIHLYLPEKAYESIEISTGVGRTTSNADLALSCLGELRIQADVGDSHFKGALRAESLRINGGVGRLQIAEAQAADLKLALDVGDVQVETLVAEQSARIGGGVGRLTVEKARLHGAELEVGVGDFEIKGELLGRTTLSQGVGRAKLDLDGDPDDYFIRFDGGIGRLEVNENHQRLGGSSGTGDYSSGPQEAPNSILVQGGIGDCTIDFHH